MTLFYYSKLSIENSERDQVVIVLMPASGRIRYYEKSDEAKKENVRFDKYSQSNMLAGLDTIMLTSFKDGYYFDEIQGKYKTLYKALGVELPQVNYKYIKEGIVDDGESEYYISDEPELKGVSGWLE